MINYSIIIPHYNSVSSLDDLLHSIGQHLDVETIIVDDKSNQEIEQYSELKKRYANECAFLDNTTLKKGAGVCRNIGLQQAKGKWVLFADSDDLFMDGWYQTVKRYENAKDDVIFFMPTSRVGTEVGKRHVKYRNLVEAYLQNKTDAEQHLRIQFFPPWSKMIRRSLVFEHQIKFDETMYSNDVMFSTKVGFYAGSIDAFKQTIYCVMDKPGTLTKNKSFDAFYTRNEVICEAYKFLKAHLPQEEFEKAYIHNTPIVNAYRTIKSGFGPANLWKILQLYRSHGIPVFTRNALNFHKIRNFLKE